MGETFGMSTCYTKGLLLTMGAQEVYNDPYSHIVLQRLSVFTRKVGILILSFFLITVMRGTCGVACEKALSTLE